MKYESIIKNIFIKHSVGNPAEVKFISAGSYGRVYKCRDENNNCYALKIYFKENAAQSEYLSLKKLSQCTAIHIPDVYFYGFKTEEIPFEYLCMEFIDGKNAFMNLKLLFASKKKKREFADQVTDALIDIHKIHGDKFGNIDNTHYDNWIDYYKNFAEDVYLKAVDKNKIKEFDRYVLKAMTKAISFFDEIFCDDISEPVLIHGDLNVMNIMVDRSLMPIAFIDPLNSIYADREYDLFQLKNLTGNAFNLYKIYKEKYPVSKNCDIKCAFYSLFNEAKVYLDTGRYTKVIMIASILNIEKELYLLNKKRNK
ncbi:MAG: fructosamine kinase family protein [Eubacterium sp.]